MNPLPVSGDVPFVLCGDLNLADNIERKIGVFVGEICIRDLGTAKELKEGHAVGSVVGQAF